MLEEHDSLVQEYLIWRGFVNAAQSLENDRKEDKLRSMSSSKISKALFNDAFTFQYSKVFDWWDFLNLNLLSQLDDSFIQTASELKNSTMYLMIVRSYQSDRLDLIQYFFEHYYHTHVASSPFKLNWQVWFSLPYNLSPKTDSYFAPFFTTEWSNALSISLENFFTAAFHKISAPKIITFHLFKNEIDVKSLEIEALKRKIQVLECEKESAASSPSKMSQTNSMADDLFNSGVSGNNANEKDNNANVVSLNEKNDQQINSQNNNVHVITSHRGPITKARFSPDGNYLATASTDATLRIWAISSSLSGTISFKQYGMLFCSGNVTSIDWDEKSESLIAFGTSDHMIKVWDIKTRKIVNEFQTQPHLPYIVDLKFNPRGHTIVFSSKASPAATKTHSMGFKSNKNPVCALQQWNYSSGAALEYLPGKILDDGSSASGTTGAGSASAVTNPNYMGVTNSISFNHNGSLFYTGSADGMIRVYDLVSNSVIQGWQAHTGEVRSICLNAEETSLFSLGDDGKIFEWNVHATSAAFRVFTVSNPIVADGTIAPPNYDLAISPNGLYLAATAGGEAFIFNAKRPSLQKMEDDEDEDRNQGKDVQLRQQKDFQNTTSQSTIPLIRSYFSHKTKSSLTTLHFSPIEYQQGKPLIVTGGDDETVRLSIADLSSRE